MTKLTPEEDFALCSPEMIAADIKQAEIDAVWRPLAEKLGWKWSTAHNHYINDAHRDPLARSEFGYELASDPEVACSISGYEDILLAIDALEKDLT